MVKEYKYRVTQIYRNLDDVRVNKKLKKPKDMGTYLGSDVYHALRDAWRMTGIHMDCLHAELVEE